MCLQIEWIGLISLDIGKGNETFKRETSQCGSDTHTASDTVTELVTLRCMSHDIRKLYQIRNFYWIGLQNLINVQ